MLELMGRHKAKVTGIHLPDSGPGPNTLIGGDEVTGFFGETTASELITGTSLSSTMNFTRGRSYNSSVGWLKFVRDRKILFIAKRPLRHELSWQDINGANLLSGNRTIWIKNVLYRVRIMTGAAGNPSTVRGGEWNDLFYRIHDNDPTNTHWARYSEAELCTGSSGGNGFYNWVQERVSINGNAIIRGADNGLTGMYNRDPARVHVLYGWRPVLEKV